MEIQAWKDKIPVVTLRNENYAEIDPKKDFEYQVSIVRSML